MVKIQQLSIVDTWPFPTQDNPLKPWTPEKEKEYRDSLNEEAPL